MVIVPQSTEIYTICIKRHVPKDLVQKLRDERYPISMFLNIEGNYIRGFYYYDKYHNNIILSARKEDGENIYVFEYDYDEEGDEYDGCEFTGKYYNGKFSGIFHRTDGQQWYFELMLEL